jgi:hypothetical protein
MVSAVCRPAGARVVVALLSLLTTALPAPAAIFKVAAAGDRTPVGGTFSTSQPPVVLGINDNAEVLFYSGITGAPGGGDVGLFLFSGGTIKAVAVDGDPSPTGGTLQVDLASAKLNATGDVAFAAGITGGRSPIAVFLWHRPIPSGQGQVSVVVADGDRAPRPALVEPKTDPDVFMFNIDLGFDLNDNGTVALFASQGKRLPAGGGVSRSNLYLAMGGPITRVLDGGKETSAGTLPLSLVTLGPFLNNNNQMLLWTIADANKQEIVVCTTGACQKVVAEGDTIPGGKWPLASGPCCMLGFNDAGQVALPGLELRGEVLIGGVGPITRLIRAGDSVADPAGSALDSLSADEIHRRRRALNSLGEMAFIGRIPNPSGSVLAGVFVISQGAIRKAALVGAAAPDAAGSFIDFGSLALSDAGCLAFSGITASPFNSGSWIADFPTVPGQPARTCGGLRGRVFVDLTRPAGPMKRDPSGFYSGELPIRRARLTLENESGTVLAETFTRDNGRYSFPPVPGPVQLRLTLEDKDKLIQVFDSATDPTRAAFARTFLFFPPASGRQDFRLRIGVGGEENAVHYDPPLDATNPTNSTSEHFAHLAYAYHNVKFATQVAKALPVQRSERVNIQSPEPTSHDCTFHLLEINTVHSDANERTRTRPFADFHEYGHHIVCASPIAGVESEPATGDVRNHAGIRNSTSSDSWGEGAASFFAAVDAQQGGDPEPHVFYWPGGKFNLVDGGARLDNPRVAGYNTTFGPLGEEFAIASVMWELHGRLGLFNRLWPILRANTPDLQNWKAMYDALKTFETANPRLFADLDGDRCTFNGNVVRGLDCLFVERGFYQDANGDGLYSAGEEVGVTRWDGDPPRGPTVRRPNVPIIPGSILRLHVVDDADGRVLDDVQFSLQIQYDPPLGENDSSDPLPVTGPQPYDIPIAVPGNPSRAIFVAQSPGYEDSAPLVIESAFFHERIDPARPGGVAEILLEHTFRLRRGAASDTTPPITTAVASPAANAAGWNNGPVTVNLSATDPALGSGVHHISAELTGAQIGTLVEPGGTASILVTAEGTTILTFAAVDNTGNQEASQTLTIRIDRSAPVLSGLPAAGCTLWPPDKRLVEVARIGAGDAVSGLASFAVTGTSSEPSTPGFPDIVITGTGLEPRVVQLRADRRGNGPGRTYTLTATATDVAGNGVSSTATCTVPHDRAKPKP